MQSERHAIPTLKPITDEIIEEQLLPLQANREQLELEIKRSTAALQANDRAQARIRGAGALVTNNMGAFNTEDFDESACVIQLFRGIRQILLNHVIGVDIAIPVYIFH